MRARSMVFALGTSVAFEQVQRSNEVATPRQLDDASCALLRLEILC